MLSSWKTTHQLRFFFAQRSAITSMIITKNNCGKISRELHALVWLKNHEWLFLSYTFFYSSLHYALSCVRFPLTIQVFWHTLYKSQAVKVNNKICGKKKSLSLTNLTQIRHNIIRLYKMGSNLMHVPGVTSHPSYDFHTFVLLSCLLWFF